ncbi:MAG: hypothetical protein NVS4B3_02650 [Gemmatimonadaceae bacterium]
MSRRRALMATSVVAAVLLIGGRALSAIYVDYAWYAALGAASLWRSKAWITLGVRFSSAAIATSFVFTNLFAVRHSIVSVVLPRRVANLEIGEEVPSRYLLGAVAVVSLLVGGILTLPASTWRVFALGMAGAPFGESDPYFQLDLAFFVYWLPVETMLYTWSLIGTLTVTAMVVVLYGLTPSLRWERGRLLVSAYVRRHLSILAGLLLALLAWSYRLDAYNLLSGGSGTAGVFTYADHRVGIPATLALSLICIATAVTVAWSGWTGQLRVALGAVTTVLLLSLIVHQGAPTVARRLDARDPVLRERPYDATRAVYTERAFGADRVVLSQDFSGQPSYADVPAMVSAWDAAALERIAVRRDAASPANPTLGWAIEPAGLVAVIPQRTGGRSSSGRVTWTVTRVLAGRSDERGGIVRIDERGEPSTDDTPIVTPLVDDSTTPYVLVEDSASAVIGSRLDGETSRLAHAWTLQNFRILFGDLPHLNPTILLHLGVRQRVALLAPIFGQSSVVWPVVSGDTLFWSVELYSTSMHYPLSRRLVIAEEETGYFRHAATALVNSVTGRVAFLADAAPDSLAAGWIRRYPALFQASSSEDARIMLRLPPSVDGLRAQALAFGDHGRRGASGRLHVPWTDGADSAMVRSTAAPFVMRRGAESVLAVAVPLLDEVERMVGVVVATGGARPTTTWVPLLGPAPRWPVALELLRLPTDTTSGLRLDGGLTRGPVRAVPLRGRALLLQSAYIHHGSAAPTLARVAIMLGDTVRAGHTLAEVARGTGEVPPRQGSGEDTLRERAVTIYTSMRAALRRGDWSSFGTGFEQLGALLGVPSP